MDSAAGHAVEVQLAVLDGELGIVDGLNACALAHEVVGTEALKVQLGILYGKLGVFGDDDAVIGLGGGAHVEVFGGMVGDGAAGDELRYPDICALIADHHGGLHVDGNVILAHQSVGFHVIVVGNGQHHVAAVGAGDDVMTNTIDDQGNVLSLRRMELCHGADGELVVVNGVLYQPVGFVDHLGMGVLVQNFHVGTSYFVSLMGASSAASLPTKRPKVNAMQ